MLPSFIPLSFPHLNFPSGKHLHSHIVASTYTREQPKEDCDYVEEDLAQLTIGAALQVPVATHYFIKVARTTMGLEWR
jgi:hypothetical protein